MDVVEALAIETMVVETRSECSDGDRARAALVEALSAARAPAHGVTRPRGARPTRGAPPNVASAGHWTVTMSVVAPKSVEATIVDDGGTLVAQRTLTDRTDRNAKVCLPLARAVGAWASLVLDAELAHAKDDDGSEPTPVSLTSTSSSAPITRSLDDQPRDRPSSIEGDGAPTKERHAVELGTMFSIGNGLTPNGGFAGLSPFVTIEVATSWLLRPSVVFGRTTSAITESTGTMSHVGARADFCRRVPGNYVERRGIEADFCLGVEGGVIASDGGATSPIRGDVGRLGLGPSATLRGELGAGLALEVRGILGANLLNQSIGDEGVAPLVFATGEIGLSVRLP